MKNMKIDKQGAGYGSTIEKSDDFMKDLPEKSDSLTRDTDWPIIVFCY